MQVSMGVVKDGNECLFCVCVCVYVYMCAYMYICLYINI